MASDDESGDVEEAVAFELEASRNVQKYRPIALEDLLKQTKFTRQEIRVMYRGFKQVSSFYNIQNVFFFFVEEQKFSEIFTENSTKLFSRSKLQWIGKTVFIWHQNHLIMCVFVPEILKSTIWQIYST